MHRLCVHFSPFGCSVNTEACLNSSLPFIEGGLMDSLWARAKPVVAFPVSAAADRREFIRQSEPLALLTEPSN